MNIVVGISHPKQIHMFKNLIFELKRKGHKFLLLVVEKEMCCRLLKELNIEYIKIGINQKKIINKILMIFPLTIITILKSLKFSPDMFIGQAIPHFAYSSYLLRKPYIIFEDTESSRLLQKIVNPFASPIVTPNCFRKELGAKQIRIDGSFELAYLRKNWFEPDKTVLKRLGLKGGEKFTIIRFVEWTANHDMGHTGISLENKFRAVNEFKKYGKVLISSEPELPEKLKQYKININVSQMHSLLHYATLVYGESATMAAEAAYLGTPAIYLDDEGRGYTDDQNKYGLVYTFSESIEDQDGSIRKAIEILASKNKKVWNENASKMIQQRIDVGSFMIWFIENYPESYERMQETPEYQNRFK